MKKLRTTTLAATLFAVPASTWAQDPPPPAAAPAAPAAPTPAALPAATPPAPQPSAQAEVSASATLAAAPAAPGDGTRRTGAPLDDTERRVVLFTDGASPKLEVLGSSSVHGSRELEVRFERANPLCYAYSTNLAASRVAATSETLPTRVPGVGALEALESERFPSVDKAFTAIGEARNDLDDIAYAANASASLADVWAACDSGDSFQTQRQRVEAAAATLAQELGPQGGWRDTLVRAASVALRAKRLAREFEAAQRDADRELNSRRSALDTAERTEKRLAERLQSNRSKAARDEHEEALRDLAQAQRAARQVEIEAAEKGQVGKLAEAASALEEAVTQTAARLAHMSQDVNRARALLARSPSAIRRRFDAGEVVNVVITRTRLENGQQVEGAERQTFEAPRFRSYKPVIFDIAIGPALVIGQNTATYETVYAPGYGPGPSDDEEPSYRTARTEQGLNLDVMVSISGYIWEPRYLDDNLFDPMQLIPRPMIGISLDRPFDRIYAGLSIDPIQFVNISGGLRIGTEPRLLGPNLLDRALLDSAQQPQDPVVRQEIKALGFASVTISTNLFFKWLSEGL